MRYYHAAEDAKLFAIVLQTAKLNTGKNTKRYVRKSRHLKKPAKRKANRNKMKCRSNEMDPALVNRGKFSRIVVALLNQVPKVHIIHLRMFICACVAAVYTECTTVQ